MAIRFVLLVNKQGQTRLSQYKKFINVKERVHQEGEIVRKCLRRSDEQCNFIQYKNIKVVYKRYASLFFIIGNELAILELIHLLVETFDQYFENVCELDVMFNIERAHFIIEEMVLNGNIIETNKKNLLEPLKLIEEHY